MFTKIKTELKDKALERGRSMSIKDLQTECNKHSDTMKTALEQAGPDMTLADIKVFGEDKPAPDLIEAMIGTHSDYAGLQDALTEKLEMKKAAEEIVNANLGPDAELKAQDDVLSQRQVQTDRPESMSTYFWKNVELDKLKKAASDPVTMTLKDGDSLPFMNTLFQRSAGWEPESIREPGYIQSPQRPVTLLDMIPSRPTMQAAVKYMRESVYTNATASRAEGTALPEGTLALAEQTATVQKYGTWLPVTEEQMEDVPEVDAYLNYRLPFMVSQSIENAIVRGNGTSPNIQGFKNIPGINSQPFVATGSGDDTVLTEATMLASVLKGVTQVRSIGYAQPTSIWAHPNTLESIIIAELSQSGYFFGNPQDGYQPRLWALPVAESTALDTGPPPASGTHIAALIGAFNMYSALRVRRDLVVRIGMQNDDFIKDQMTMKATVRFVLVVYRPQAFTQMLWPRL